MVQSTSSGIGSGGNGNGYGNGNGSDNESNDDQSSNDGSENGPEFEQTTVAPPTTPFVIKHPERQCCGEFPNRAPYHKESFIVETIALGKNSNFMKNLFRVVHGF